MWTLRAHRSAPGHPGAHRAGAALLQPLIKALCPGHTRLAHTTSRERRDVQRAPSPLPHSLGGRIQLGVMQVSPTVLQCLQPVPTLTWGCSLGL